MSSWSYSLEMFIKGFLVVGILFLARSFGVLGSVFLMGISSVLFSLSVFGRFNNRSRYRYPAIFIEILLAVFSIGVVGYVYLVNYISFDYAMFLSSFILFAVSILGWFMSDNKFVYQFVHRKMYEWGSDRRVLEVSPSRLELFLLNRIYGREVEFERLFKSAEVCVMEVEGSEFWLTFVDDFEVLLGSAESGRERDCELCRDRSDELVDTGSYVERFRSRDISLASQDCICVDCQEELLEVLVDRGILDSPDVFVSKI